MRQRFEPVLTRGANRMVGGGVRFFYACWNARFPNIKSALRCADSRKKASEGAVFECANHPGGDAAWLCNGCEQYFCDACVSTRRFGRTDVDVCKGCGDMVTAVVAGVTMQDAGEHPALSSSFAWPLQGSGPMILFTGTVVLGILGMFSGLIAWGLMLGYGMSVIQQTAKGRQDAPEWPDVDGWSDILMPAVLGLATAALSFGPAVWLAANGASTFAIVAAVGLGALYAPMAWMAASVSQRFLAITPLTILPLLTRANGSYWLGCGFLFLAFGLGLVADAILQAIAPAIVVVFAGTAAALFTTMVEMRILGLIWCHHREDFGLE